MQATRVIAGVSQDSRVPLSPCGIVPPIDASRKSQPCSHKQSLWRKQLSLCCQRRSIASVPAPATYGNHYVKVCHVCACAMLR